MGEEKSKNGYHGGDGNGDGDYNTNGDGDGDGNGNGNQLSLPHAVEVELIIMAHFCHVQACSATGIQDVLHRIHIRTKEYVRAKNFRLLVRLLTGAPL